MVVKVTMERFKLIENLIKHRAVTSLETHENWKGNLAEVICKISDGKSSKHIFLGSEPE